MTAITLITGAAETIQYEILAPDTNFAGDAFDLTDYNVDFFIKRSMQDSDLAAEFHGTLDEGIELAYTAKDGVVNVKIPSAATSNLRLGRPYPFYLKVTKAGDPTDIFTPVQGEFIVLLPRDQ